MDAKSLPTLNALVNHLMGDLVAKQVELQRREQSCGTFHDVRKMTRLRAEITKIEKRLARAELLQNVALKGT